MQRTMERIYRRSSDFLAEVLGCKVDFGPLNFFVEDVPRTFDGKLYANILPYSAFWLVLINEKAQLL